MKLKLWIPLIPGLMICPEFLFAQSNDLKLTDWRPKSQLVVKETQVLKPRYPVIDIHNHLGDLENTEKYLEEMDKAGVWKCVSLDGRSENDFYKEHLKVSLATARDRFIVFFRPDFTNIDAPDFGIKEADKLENAVKMGARGMKISKVLGLTVKDKSGKLVPVDDPRIDPLWARCGKLGIPVMIHVSDPKAFFTPLDKYNERYDELAAHPDWLFYGDSYPSKMEILEQRNRVIARHPETIFVGAHVGTLPEELHMVSNWLDAYPNFYVDIDARISDLGRQPYTARKFFIKYQDRILFGTDTEPNAEAYRIYYRFLETDDEYFNPSGGHHQQGRWNIYGVYLPDEVLEKIYNKNALKILGMYNSPAK
ncbi:MAG TPA: amidohydrolase family protein [Cyclobacteriaceae bacterium]|nr:amidohydrolase family protein [Cyclobacteriaceae bacterium]